jgi:hypothetical protein
MERRMRLPANPRQPVRVSPTEILKLLIYFIVKGQLQYLIGSKNGRQNQSSPTGDKKNGTGGDRGGRAMGQRPRAELTAASGGAHGGLRRSPQRGSSSGRAATGQRPPEELMAAAWRRGGAPDGGSLPKKLKAARLKARRSRCLSMALLWR